MMAAKEGCVPKLKDLVYELKGVDWHALGIELDVPPHTLRSIERDNVTQDRRLSEVIQFWMNNGKPSWQEIIKALKRIGGHGNIVTTIETEYIRLPRSQRAVVTSSMVDGSTRLNEKDHHRKLLEQLSTHASKWREIGTWLGFAQGELDNIQSSPMLLGKAPLSYLNALLSKWLQWAPSDSRDYARLGALKDAVSRTGLGVTANSLTV